jgi:peptide subunit release factor 1 (eRF1)
LFEAIPLPRPTKMRAFIDDSPYVTPLVAAADTRDWLIVVVDAKNARLLHGNSERVEEFERVKDGVAGQHEESGPTDHQRWVEHQIDQHLDHVAREVDAHLHEADYRHIAVGAPPEIAPRFESMLSATARERLAGRFALDLHSATPDAIRHAALPCFEAQERRRERELLDRMTERLGMGERAVAGAADVRDMLVQRRAEVLLFEQGYEFADPAGSSGWSRRRSPRTPRSYRSGTSRRNSRCSPTSPHSCASERDQARVTRCCARHAGGRKSVITPEVRTLRATCWLTVLARRSLEISPTASISLAVPGSREPTRMNPPRSER